MSFLACLSICLVMGCAVVIRLKWGYLHGLIIFIFNFISCLLRVCETFEKACTRFKYCNYISCWGNSFFVAWVLSDYLDWVTIVAHQCFLYDSMQNLFNHWFVTQSVTEANDEVVVGGRMVPAPPMLAPPNVPPSQPFGREVSVIRRMIFRLWIKRLSYHVWKSCTLP